MKLVASHPAKRSATAAGLEDGVDMRAPVRAVQAQLELPVLLQPAAMAWWGTGAPQQQPVAHTDRMRSNGMEQTELSLGQWAPGLSDRHSRSSMADDEDTDDTACSSCSSEGSFDLATLQPAGPAPGWAAAAAVSPAQAPGTGEDDSITSSQPVAAPSPAFSFGRLAGESSCLMPAWPLVALAR